MSKRFFTADFHLGDQLLLDKKFMNGHQRPFKDSNDMNLHLIQMCNEKAKVYEDEDGFIIDKDTIVHIGDFACVGSDRGFRGLDVNPQEYVFKINANFINIHGNHDTNNSVKSMFNSVHLNLGRRYPSVTAGHYPSYDRRSASYTISGFINICGHVHSKWKHCLDLDLQILNINVGVDAWNYSIVSEEELIKYIDMLLRKRPDELYRCKIDLKTKKIMFYGNSKI